MKEFSLRGSIVAIVTPFKLNGEIDFEAYDRLVEWYIQEGTDGIVVCGTTGETPALNADEDAQMIERTVKLVNGRVTVIAGTGSNSTEECIKYSQKAQDLGVDAVLVVGPYYNKPTDKGMYMHFSKVAQSIDIPVVLYNVPSRTGSKISVDVVLKLADEFENIVGIKEASGDLGVATALLEKRPQGFKIYSGDDFLSPTMNLLGADGCISVAANVVPLDFKRLMDASMNGDVVLTRELFFKYQELMDVMFIESNPMPVKAALAMMGKIQEVYRSPMCPMEEGNRQKVEQKLKELGII